MPQPPSERALKLAGQVLAKIAAYEPRFPQPSQAMLNAWAEHITIRNPDPEAMLDAVAQYFAEPHDSLPTPFAISNIARTRRQEAMSRDPQPPPDKAADPAPPELPGVQKMSMAEWEAKHGVKFPELVLGKSLDNDYVTNPLRVRCPHCGASEGSPCMVAGTAQLLTKVRAHESRMAIVEARCGGMHHEHPHTSGCELA